MKMKNILFYKYVEIDNLESLRKILLDNSLRLGLLGKILISEEGINGCVSGSTDDIEKFKQLLHSDERFSDIQFKEGLTEEHTFKKMFVRIRKEIVSLRQEVDLDNKALYIQPRELNDLLEKGDVIMVDARNNYESRIGRFKDAVTPDIDKFSEWPEAVKEMENLKDKTIVTYCTGGIRCEKASAYLRERGFRDVRQLHGGILNYGKEAGDRHWEGKCFVFDYRKAVSIDPESDAEPITECELCGVSSDNYNNCRRVSCDRLFIGCDDCLKEYEFCCSSDCWKSDDRKLPGIPQTI